MNGHARFLGSPWMIRPEAFRALCAVEVPDHAYAAAMAARQEEGPASSGDSPYQTVGGIAVIPIMGPIYRRSSAIGDFLAFLFGGCCLEDVDAAVSAAVADPEVRAILLDVDSPGGEAAGIGEMAGKIRQAATLKPTAAYVESMCCSAAYWLASATGEIAASPIALVGSIGTVMVLVDDTGFQEQIGIKEWPIVSSQSPDKWPDVATEKGRATYQPIVDALSSVFIGDVAAYRDTTMEAVLRDFGKGGVLVGDAARRAGMVDKIASREATIRKLSGSNRARLATARPIGASAPTHAQVYRGVISRLRRAGVTSQVIDTSPPPTPLRARLISLRPRRA